MAATGRTRTAGVEVDDGHNVSVGGFDPDVFDSSVFDTDSSTSKYKQRIAGVEQDLD